MVVIRLDSEIWIFLRFFFLLNHSQQIIWAASQQAFSFDVAKKNIHETMINYTILLLFSSKYTRIDATNGENKAKNPNNIMRFGMSNTMSCPLTAELISLNHFADTSCRLSTLDLHANELGVSVAHIDSCPLTQLILTQHISFTTALFFFALLILSKANLFTSLFCACFDHQIGYITIICYFWNTFMGLCTLSCVLCSTKKKIIIKLLTFVIEAISFFHSTSWTTSAQQIIRFQCIFSLFLSSSSFF